MSFKYGAYIKHFYYLKKGEVKMENKFKPGDLVFEVSDIEGVSLTEVTTFDNKTYSIKGNSGLYTANGQGFDNFKSIPSMFHATPENRQALVTLYGEDAVPKLPLRGSELTRELLKKQKYVICWVNTYSDEYARNASRMVHIATEVEDDGFTLSNGGFAEFAVPVDMNGNEITEVE